MTDVYFTGDREVFEVKRVHGTPQNAGHKGRLIHLFDQPRNGPGLMVSHFLLLREGDIPVLVHDAGNGKYIEGYFEPPGDKQKDGVRRRIFKLGVEVYHGGKHDKRGGKTEGGS